MPKEIYPSSYVCDCGQESHHFENTIRELKEDSYRRRQTLIADDGKHKIIFKDGRMLAMYCPIAGRQLAASKRARGDPNSHGNRKR